MTAAPTKTKAGDGAPQGRIGTETIPGLPRPFARVLEAGSDRIDADRIVEAYKLADRAHRGQRRASGESYMTHTVEVATMLARMRLDTDSIIAGLVHDTVEDTDLSIEDIRERFGDAVATIVSGVTKIGRVRFRSASEQQAENYRKMLLSMSEDVRVILVKLADRLHNMRTLEHLPEGKRRRIAFETRDIYAPLAHRLGMGAIRWELEDLAFKFLESAEFEALARKVRQRRKDREREIAALRRPLESALHDAGIPAEVHGRPKHLWSIQRKMTVRGKPYEEIYDLMAMRVLTDTVEHCYSALGVIHSMWTPIPERFHDYLATPKSNLYRSLHTTVVGPGGRRYEIQIRTEEMHRIAEYGIAAHWRYKEGGRKGNSAEDEALAWARQVIEWQAEAESPNEFMKQFHLDLFRGEIFVFTPRGEVKVLPEGSTPIDFAYSVHTEVGHRCAGATVNGRITPLSRQLKNGDTVEIRTDARQRPNRDWLAFVKTTRARGRIRHWIRKVEFDSAMQLGRDLLERELRRVHRRLPQDHKLQEEAADALGHNGFDVLLAALGRGEVGPTAVIRQFHPDHDPTETPRPQKNPLGRIVSRLRVSGKGVRIQGMDNLMVRYSRCCQPVPGDEVVGYVTRGRGVSLHRTDCPNVLALAADPERRIEIEWTAEKLDRFLVRLYMRGTDRRGLLSDVAKAITKTGTDIKRADMRSVEGGMQGEFVVEVRDLSHLEKVRRAIGRIEGVLQVERREHFEEDDLGWA